MISFARFFCDVNGERLGPLTPEEVVGLVKAGTVQPDGKLWKRWEKDGKLTFTCGRVGVLLPKNSASR